MKYDKKRRMISNSLIPCACGCNQTLLKYDRDGNEKKYVHGHANRGKKHSSQSIELMKIKHKGKILSDATKKKLSIAHKGMKRSETHRKNISLAKTNEKHHNWKGDDVKYVALHQWIRKNKPKPDVCEICRITPPREVANISKNYLRDIDDYMWLCHKCHIIYDDDYVPFVKSSRRNRIDNDSDINKLQNYMKSVGDA
jgi:Zn-finger protein